MRPTVSVVIPTFNRAEALSVALNGWQRQAPEDVTFELILVDDGSTDGTRALLGGLRPQRFSWRTLHQPNTGPAGARNLGLSHARGEYVLFSGDDIEPSPSLLAEHLRGHELAGDPRRAVLGLTRWPEGDELTATMRHIDGAGAQQFSYAWMKHGEIYDFRHFYTSNISVHRDLMAREATGFSTDFPAAAFEDAELAYRLAARGLRIVYRQSAVAWHHHHYGVRSFFRRQRRCGQMAAVLWTKKPALARWTSLHDLEWLLMQATHLGRRDQQRVEQVASALDAWNNRAISIAGFYDHLQPHPTGLDQLLLPLFHHALLCGLAEALYPESLARRAGAVSFVALIPKAVADYRQSLREENLHCPVADAEAILGLVGE